MSGAEDVMVRRAVAGFLMLGLAGCMGPAGKMPRSPLMGEGELAPDFTLPDAHGGTVTLSDAEKNGPVLLIFYLGYSCPRCVEHLRSVSDRIDEFKKLGTTVLAVSPDTLAETRDSVRTYDEDFSFPLLSDPDKSVARRYGMAPPGATMLHGVFVIDRRGVIRFAARGAHPFGDVDALLAKVKAAS